MYKKTKGQNKKNLFQQKEERGAILIGLAVTAVIGGFLWYFKAAIGKELLYASGTLLLGVSRMLFGISANIFETVGGSALLQEPITRGGSAMASMVIHGWSITRDFANMFIVIGFVVIGIAFILRIEGYGTKKALMSLIIVALLINFSMLLCGIIIDGTNITMNYFTQISGPGGITSAYTSMVADPQIDNKLTAYKDTGDWENYASYAASISLYVAISAMIFFIYSILFLLRYVALACLVILSPLGFVCYVFPATKQVFSKWWNQFVQWSIIGVPTAFFIYLAGHLLTQSTNASTNNVLSFWIPTAFLLFAYSLIFQTSAIGASAAIGLATGAVGFAGGAIRGTTKFAGKRAWNSRAGQKARRGLTRVGEGLGVVAPGTANLMQQKHLQEHESEKRAATWSVEQRKALATGRTPITRRGRNDKVEAIKQMAEKGELGSLNHTELQSAMAYIKSSGVPAKVLAEKDYRAAGHDEKRVEAYRATHGFTNGLPTTMDDSRRAVRSEQLSENLSKMNGKQLRNITATDLELDPHNSDSHDMIREQFTPNMAKQFKTADPDRRAALLSHVGAVGVPNTLENDIHIATDPREKTRLTKLKDSIIKATT